MKKLTVLAVEDERAILALYEILLTQWGFSVVPVPSVGDALDALNSQHIDILLTDEVLDDGNGLEVARASKKQNPERPIVVCSGTVSNDSELGRLADTVLTKPFSIQELELALAAQLLRCESTVSEGDGGVTLGMIYTFLDRVDRTVHLADNNLPELRFYTAYAGIIRRLNEALPVDLGVAPERVTQLKNDVVITGESLTIFREAEALFREFEAQRERT